jgi:hypothetical protein
MLTPRHQALLATLAGMIVGVSAVGAFVAVRDTPITGGPEPSVSSTVQGTTQPAATPGPAAFSIDSLTFERRSFGPSGAGISVEVPTGWTVDQRSSYDIRFYHPTGVWMVRFDGTTSGKNVVTQAVSKRNSVRRERDFRVVREYGGTIAASWNAGGLTHRTLVYSYTNTRDHPARRGPRLVMSRWISLDADGRSAVEITVSGRPQDDAGLDALLTRASETLFLA